jgi:nucleoside 2-deoxyribosyltransferase
MKKLYLAGPMRGIKDYNFPAFRQRAADLRDVGYEVWSPAERDIKDDGFDPTKDKPRPIKEYMEHDLAAVCRCDAVVALDGWEKSQGATLEIYVARALGMPIYSEDMMKIEPPGPTVLQEADALIHGDRNASYGPPNQDFRRTADMWTALLQYKLQDGQRIRAQDVAWMMMLLKASRAQHSDKRDHYVDAAGYAGCGWRCVEAKTP